MRRNLVTLLSCLALSACGLFTSSRPAIVREIPPAPAVLVPDESSISVTWIGHATALIRIDDRWFLTDPVLFDTIAGGLYPRQVQPGIDVDALPPLDAVVVSHAHFDHLDPPSLRRLPPTKVVAAPAGAVEFLPGDMPAGAVSGLGPWESWTAGGVTITAVPSSHGDGRYVVDVWNSGTHAGFVIEYRGRTVYFAGDTGYDRMDALALADRFDIDVALIPVGPAGRSRLMEWMRRDVHVDPDGAMALFRDCGAQWMVPVHFGTFFRHPDRERPFVVAAIDRAGFEDRVRVLDIGESTEFLY